MNPSEAPPLPRRSVLDFGPRTRVAFAVAYVAIMAAVIVSAQFRPDHVFGFQMFNQSSTVDIHLARQVRGRRKAIPIVDGSWQAADKAGTVRTFHWQDRVKDSVLSTLERPVHARYGLEGQLFRLPFALEDVLEHIPEDAETTGLVATVFASKNGRAPIKLRFSAERR